MYDIADILRSLLDQYTSPSEAEEAFARMLEDDNSLKSEYKEWCHARGVSTRKGYQSYLDELIESRDSIWENLNE